MISGTPYIYITIFDKYLLSQNRLHFGMENLNQTSSRIKPRIQKCNKKYNIPFEITKLITTSGVPEVKKFVDWFRMLGNPFEENVKYVS